MIPKLRKKFISITAAALFAMILAVVGAINCIFYLQNMRLLSSHLDMMLEENWTGTADSQDRTGDSGFLPDGSAPPERKVRPEGQRPPGNMDFRLFPRFENDLRMRADGCVIVLDNNGEILEIRQDAAGSYSEEEMASVADKILGSGKSQGWQQYYRFRVTERLTQEGAPVTVIGLINGSSALYSVFTMLSVSAVTGLFSFLTVLLIVLLASGRAVRPIAESYARQKQFVTDAGHELKTPLTVISADNELARMLYGDSEWFDGIDKQVEKMNGLVRSLIDLAKMDEEQKPVFASFCLSDAVYDTAKSFENLIHAGGRLLTLDIAENIYYHGDESRLRQIVSILMDNAVKYCSEKGKIAVRLTAEKSVKLQVTNDYASPDQFDPEKVFERFYRADKARTSDGSYGLGLSIARSIAQLHHGQIRAKALEHSRVQFEVTLPKSK